MPKRVSRQESIRIESLEPLILMSASIQGTDAGEWISGDEMDNEILALGGDDAIHAPLGNNVIDGGSGEDTFVIYEGVQADFEVTKTADDIVFVKGPGLNGQVNTNELRNVEHIAFNGGGLLVADIPGGSEPPTPEPPTPEPPTPEPPTPEPPAGANIVGTDAGEWIDVSEGDDVVDARGGDDAIYASLGNNIIYGGAGDDALVTYEGNEADFEVLRFSDGVVQVKGPGLNGLQITNLLVDVERILFLDGATELSTVPVTPGPSPLPTPEPPTPEPPVPGNNGEIGLTLESLTIDESVGELTFILFRGNGTDGEVSVDYTTVSGTADADDYQEISGTAVFAEGVTGQQLTLNIANDDLVEPNETFSLVLTNPTGGAALGAITTQVVTIADNDDVEPGIIFEDSFETSNTWITNPYSTDTATTGQWAIGAPQQTSSNGNIIQLGAGHTGSRALVTGLASGSSVGAFDIDRGLTSVLSPEINLPSGAEIELSFEYNFAYLSNASNDDFFHFAIVADGVEYEMYDDHAHNAVQAGQWIDYSTDISQFAGQTIQILFEAGDIAGASLIEAAVDDVVVEVLPNLPGTISVDTTGVNLAESDGLATIRVSRHIGRQGAVTVDYATVAGTAGAADFTPVSGTLSFADGEFEKTITVAITEDTIVEDLESFEVVLSNATGGALIGTEDRAVVTIVDNDNVTTDWLPDLTPIASTLTDQLSIDTNEIPGRQLLRFSTEVANAGDGPLEIWGGSTSGDAQQVFQRIYQEGGGYRDDLAGVFVYHPGHGHIHFEGFATYDLRLVNGNGDIVASGGKTSFCLININQPYPDVTANAQMVHGRGGTSCGQVQGISTGYSDVYSASLDDQWIDVTDVNPGTYWLEIETDPENNIQETDETNNRARVQVRLNADGTVTAIG